MKKHENLAYSVGEKKAYEHGEEKICVVVKGKEKKAVLKITYRQVDQIRFKMVRYLSFIVEYVEDGMVNILVEIPAGTNAKWEINKDNGNLDWEIKNGKPRVVQYLPYPSNYGMIPKTLSAEELGGDGDPLDVILLGDAVPRGEVVKARLVGVMRMIDDGEQDDKLLAVLDGSVFADIEKLDELKDNYEGLLTILQTWFTNYKGNDQIEINSFGDEVEAKEILLKAVEEYKIYGKK